ncbi:MAG: ThuA domain-containing protein, partial [Candidatus Poribacteria bacterium]|nr:ThuA domain-containing protein [Candidatus Poribacteria bacterium]
MALLHGYWCLNFSPRNQTFGLYQSGRRIHRLHTAAASFRECEGYHDMLNAFFDGHSKNMDFAVNIIDNKEPITQELEGFVVTDELYYLKHDPTTSHHLMEAYDPAK